MPSVSHDNKTLPFKPGQILLAIYHSQTKLNILVTIYHFALKILRYIVTQYIYSVFSLNTLGKENAPPNFTYKYSVLPDLINQK